jgi:mRNA interferase RelE/StbE
LSNAYRIFETDVFLEDIQELNPGILEKIRKKLDEHAYPALKQQPHFGRNIKKLSDYTPPTWRYRIGDFRIFYSINDESKIVYMLTISDRKDAY